MSEGQKRKPSIVCIGGGTGQATVLRGLKNYRCNIVAVVGVTDSGRSSGKLRRDLEMLPPGDIRNCLVALSRSEKLLHDLFQYRFETGEGLNGMSFGNLLIAALAKIKGGFDLAVKETSKILNIQGKVLPATLRDTHICAELEDGTIIEEEFNVREPNKLPIRRVFLLHDDVCSYEECLTEIESADLIVLGPGSLYTSVVVNLLIKDITEAIRASKGKKVYICNLMTQPGQTDNYTGIQHVTEIVQYLGEGVLDYVIFNNELPSQDLLDRYAQEEEAYPLAIHEEEIEALGITSIARSIVDKTREKRELWQKQDFLRHDPDKLASILISLASDPSVIHSPQ